MHPLLLRVISAAAAIILVGGTGFLWASQGLTLASGLVIVAGSWEFQKLILSPYRGVFQVLFLGCAMGFLALAGGWPQNYELFLLAAILAYWMGGLAAGRKQQTAEQLVIILTFGAVGLLLTVAFPLFTIKILNLKAGVLWFSIHLVTVFSGDTAAYFGGKWLGKSKLAPVISPKKTIAGGLFSLGTSVGVGSFLLVYWFSALPATAAIGITFVVSLSAQAGDLFVSVLKRSAHIKDSGHVMPGHGGVLDRLDGVYFSAPVFFAFAYYAELVFV